MLYFVWWSLSILADSDLKRWYRDRLSASTKIIEGLSEERVSLNGFNFLPLIL